MSGNSQKDFIHRAGFLAVWLLILCVYFAGVREYIQMRNEPGISVFLSSVYPQEKEVQEILKQEEKSDLPEDVCFYSDGGLQEISQKDGNRQTEVLVGYIKGNSAVYDWQAGGMTKEDPDGCIIDRTAAWELFGNEAAGGQILVQDHIYTVRKVADWGQKILLLGAAQKGEKELSYSRIFIRKRNNKTVQNMVSGFLTKYNLQGTIVSSNLPRIAGFTALLLFPGLVFCCLWREVCREKRKYTIKEAGYWIWNILYFAIAGFVIWLFVTRASWPEDWIPPQWSDFTFWQKKITSFSSDFRLYLALPKSAVQTRQLLLGGKTICCGVLSCFIYLLMKVYGGRSNDKNPVDF